MSEQQALTLQIRGNSQEAVAAIKQATEALGKLVGASVEVGNKADQAGKKASTALDRMRQSAQRAERAVDGLQSVSLKLAGALGVLAGGMGVAAKSGLDLNEALVKAERSFTHLSGSAKAAQGLLRALRAEAEVTGQDFLELVPIAQSIASAYEGDLSKVLPVVRAFGDAARIAGASTEQMKQSLLGFRQIVSSGLQGDEIRQIQEGLPGINVRKILEERLGSGDTRVLQQARITGQEIGDAIVAGMQQRFGGASRSGGGDIDALANRLRDQFRGIAAQLTTEFRPAVKESLGTLSRSLKELAGDKEAIEALKQPFKELGEGLKAAAAQVERVVDWFQQLTPEQKKAAVETATTTTKVLAFTAALTGIASVGARVVGWVAKLVEGLKTLWGWLGKAWPVLGRWAGGVGNGLKMAVNWATTGGMGRGLAGIGKGLEAAVDWTATRMLLPGYAPPVTALGTVVGGGVASGAALGSLLAIPGGIAYGIGNQRIAQSEAEMRGYEQPEIGLWQAHLRELRQQLKADPYNPDLLKRMQGVQEYIQRVVGPSRRPGAQGLPNLQVKPGVNLEGLTDPAREEARKFGEWLGVQGHRGIITSGKRSNANVRSRHNSGNAVDLVVPGVDMAELARRAREAGFNIQFERKGQRNANGSVATGPHLHLSGGSSATSDRNADPRVAAELARKQAEAAEKARKEAERLAADRAKFSQSVREAQIAALPEVTPEDRRRKRVAELQLEEQQAVALLEEQFRDARIKSREDLEKAVAAVQARYKAERVQAYEQEARELREIDAQRQAYEEQHQRERLQGLLQAVDQLGFQAEEQARQAGQSDEAIARARLEAQAKALAGFLRNVTADVVGTDGLRQLRELQLGVQRGLGQSDLNTLAMQLETVRQQVQSGGLSEAAGIPQQRQLLQQMLALQTSEAGRLQIRRELLDLQEQEQRLNEEALRQAEARAEAEARLVQSIRERTRQLREGETRLAERRAEAEGPAALEEFLRGGLADVQLLQNALRQYDTPRANRIEDPRQREAELLRIADQLLALRTRQFEIEQRLARLAKDRADSERQAAEAVFAAEKVQAEQRAEVQAQEDRLRRQLEERQAERAGGSTLREYLQRRLAEVRNEIALQSQLATGSGEIADQAQVNLFGLQFDEAELLDRLQRFRPRWKAFWQDLGQDAAQGLKATVAGALEDALMGDFSAQRLGENLRLILARGISVALTETIAAQIQNAFRGVFGGGRRDTGGEVLPGGTDSEAVGLGSEGEKSGVAGAQKAAGRLRTTALTAAQSLAGLTGVFLKGRAQMAVVLVQFVLALIQAVIAIKAAAAAAGGGFGGLLGAIFSFDDTRQDSQARTFGFKSVFGVEKPQVGRWGFDFGTAWQQGAMDRLRGQVQAAPPQASAPTAPSEWNGPLIGAIHQTINGGIHSSLDLERSYEDMGWVFARRLRLASE